jgi:putative transcriptional regulator
VLSDKRNLALGFFRRLAIRLGAGAAHQHRPLAVAEAVGLQEGLHTLLVAVMRKQTMREFDELCLTPVRPLTPEGIRELREREGVSQAVFARYLNVPTGLVSQWERGEKHPQGASLKLLALIAKNGLSGVA